MEVGSFILLFSSVVSQGSYARMPCGTLLTSAVLSFEMNFKLSAGAQSVFLEELVFALFVYIYIYSDIVHTPCHLST